MNLPQRYRDRREAGRILAVHLLTHCEHGDAVVLALPRGGVPVAVEVARGLASPMDLLLVHNLRLPAHPEQAVGTIGADGFESMNQSVIQRLGVSCLQLAALADRERVELHRREAFYHREHAPVDLRHHTTILVDDGITDGPTMLAAILAARERGAGRLIVAAPIGAVDACEEIRREVDALVCPLKPDPLYTLGYWYNNFSPVSDEEVRRCLDEAAEHLPAMADQA
jgi:putative phosphoribosyl transferase